MTMEVLPQNDAEEASRVAAESVARAIRANSDLVLGCAAGHTPVRLYAELAHMHREEALSFSRVTVFMLDEFIGLPEGHAAAFRSFLTSHFFSRVNVASSRIHAPDVHARDLTAACEAYEKAIAAAGGIGLLILGVGKNGHIGFNEPGTPVESRTRVQDLSDATRKDHAESFGNLRRVPKQALTLGIGTILESRHIFLLAFGRTKAKVVKRMVEGPSARSVPCTALRPHPNVTVVLDAEAASGLSKKYRPLMR